MTMMPAHPTIAVICCFLNGGEFLAEAIDSVMAQDYPSWTLTLVDDGSTDGASDIARTYARLDGRIRYVEHEGHANLGLSASRNVGLARSEGPLVAFIDADDAWLPAKLKEQVAIMASDPDLGMVCGATVYWRSWRHGEDVTIPSGHRFNARIDPPEALLELYPIGRAPAPPPSGLLCRRDIVERLGGFEAAFCGIYGLYEDQAFLCKLYLEAPVYFSDRVWLRYRQHDGSIMASVIADGRYHEVRRYFLKWYRDYLDDRPKIDRRVSEAVNCALRPYLIPGGAWLLRRRRRPKFGVLRRMRRWLAQA